MTTIFRILKYAIILLLLIGLAQWGGVTERYLENKVVESHHDTLIETELKIDTLTNVIKEKETIIKEVEVSKPAKIDTLKIIKDFFKKRIYTHKYQDSNLEATIIDTVAFNKLIGQSMKYTVYRPTITKTETITITKKPVINTALYFNTIYSKNNIKFGATITHKKYIFGAALNPFNKTYQLNGGILLYKR